MLIFPLLIGLFHCLESAREICVCQFLCPGVCDRKWKLENVLDVAELIGPLKTRKMSIGFSSLEGSEFMFDLRHIENSDVTFYSLDDGHVANVRFPFSEETNLATYTASVAFRNISAHFVNVDSRSVNQLALKSIQFYSSFASFEPEKPIVLEAGYVEGESSAVAQFHEIHIIDGFDMQLKLVVEGETTSAITRGDHQLIFRENSDLKVLFESSMNVQIEGSSFRLYDAAGVSSSSLPKVNLKNVSRVVLINMTSPGSDCLPVIESDEATILVNGNVVPYSLDIIALTFILQGGTVEVFGDIICENLTFEPMENPIASRSALRGGNLTAVQIIVLDELADVEFKTWTALGLTASPVYLTIGTMGISTFTVTEKLFCAFTESIYNPLNMMVNIDGYKTDSELSLLFADRNRSVLVLPNEAYYDGNCTVNFITERKVPGFTASRSCLSTWVDISAKDVFKVMISLDEYPSEVPYCLCYHIQYSEDRCSDGCHLYSIALETCDLGYQILPGMKNVVVEAQHNLIIDLESIEVSEAMNISVMGLYGGGAIRIKARGISTAVNKLSVIGEHLDLAFEDDWTDVPNLMFSCTFTPWGNITFDSSCVTVNESSLPSFAQVVFYVPHLVCYLKVTDSVVFSESGITLNGGVFQWEKCPDTVLNFCLPGTGVLTLQNTGGPMQYPGLVIDLVSDTVIKFAGDWTEVSFNPGLTVNHGIYALTAETERPTFPDGLVYSGSGKVMEKIDCSNESLTVLICAYGINESECPSQESYDAVMALEEVESSLSQEYADMSVVNIDVVDSTEDHRVHVSMKSLGNRVVSIAGPDGTTAYVHIDFTETPDEDRFASLSLTNVILTGTASQQVNVGELELVNVTVSAFSGVTLDARSLSCSFDDLTAFDGVVVTNALSLQGQLRPLPSPIKVSEPLGLIYLYPLGNTSLTFGSSAISINGSEAMTFSANASIFVYPEKGSTMTFVPPQGEVFDDLPVVCVTLRYVSTLVFEKGWPVSDAYQACLFNVTGTVAIGPNDSWAEIMLRDENIPLSIWNLRTDQSGRGYCNHIATLVAEAPSVSITGFVMETYALNVIAFRNPGNTTRVTFGLKGGIKIADNWDWREPAFVMRTSTIHVIVDKFYGFDGGPIQFGKKASYISLQTTMDLDGMSQITVNKPCDLVHFLPEMCIYTPFLEGPPDESLLGKLVGQKYTPLRLPTQELRRSGRTWEISMANNLDIKSSNENIRGFYIKHWYTGFYPKDMIWGLSSIKLEFDLNFENPRLLSNASATFIGPPSSLPYTWCFSTGVDGRYLQNTTCLALHHRAESNGTFDFNPYWRTWKMYVSDVNLIREIEIEKDTNTGANLTLDFVTGVVQGFFNNVSLKITCDDGVLTVQLPDKAYSSFFHTLVFDGFTFNRSMLDPTLKSVWLGPSMKFVDDYVTDLPETLNLTTTMEDFVSQGCVAGNSGLWRNAASYVLETSESVDVTLGNGYMSTPLCEDRKTYLTRENITGDFSVKIQSDLALILSEDVEVDKIPDFGVIVDADDISLYLEGGVSEESVDKWYQWLPDSKFKIDANGRHFTVRGTNGYLPPNLFVGDTSGITYVNLDNNTGQLWHVSINQTITDLEAYFPMDYVDPPTVYGEAPVFSGTNVLLQGDTLSEWWYAPKFNLTSPTMKANSSTFFNSSLVVTGPLVIEPGAVVTIGEYLDAGSLKIHWLEDQWGYIKFDKYRSGSALQIEVVFDGGPSPDGAKYDGFLWEHEHTFMEFGQYVSCEDFQDRITFTSPYGPFDSGNKDFIFNVTCASGRISALATRQLKPVPTNTPLPTRTYYPSSEIPVTSYVPVTTYSQVPTYTVVPTYSVLPSVTVVPTYVTLTPETTGSAKKMSAAAGAAIALGCVAVVAAIGVIIFVIVRRRGSVHGLTTLPLTQGTLLTED